MIIATPTFLPDVTTPPFTTVIPVGVTGLGVSIGPMGPKGPAGPAGPMGPKGATGIAFCSLHSVLHYKYLVVDCTTLIQSLSPFSQVLVDL